MSISQKGTAVVYKRDGTVAWTGQAASTQQIVNNLTSRDDFNPQKLIIAGKTLAIGADERTESITVNITPAALTTNTLANAEAACEKPDPLDIVTLAGWPDDIDGTYQYMGGEITFPDGFVQHTMNLERFNGSPLAALT